jgi:hypothetical protein
LLLEVLENGLGGFWMEKANKRTSKCVINIY